MVDIFRKCFWKWAQKVKKWVLVSWNALTLPKIVGGLSLRDPYTLNQVMGAKLWWRWLKGGPDLWKKIWTQKIRNVDPT